MINEILNKREREDWKGASQNVCVKCKHINARAGMMQSTTAFLSYFAWIISKREREDWKFSFMILSLPLKKSLTL